MGSNLRSPRFCLLRCWLGILRRGKGRGARVQRFRYLVFVSRRHGRRRVPVRHGDGCPREPRLGCASRAALRAMRHVRRLRAFGAGGAYAVLRSGEPLRYMVPVREPAALHRVDGRMADHAGFGALVGGIGHDRRKGGRAVSIPLPGNRRCCGGRRRDGLYRRAAVVDGGRRVLEHLASGRAVRRVRRKLRLRLYLVFRFHPLGISAKVPGAERRCPPVARGGACR